MTPLDPCSPERASGGGTVQSGVRRPMETGLLRSPRAADAQSWNLHTPKLIPDQTVWNFLQLIMTDHTLRAGNPLKLTENTHTWNI